MANVLIVIPDHEYGGEENRSHRIYRGLKEKGHSVTFVSSDTQYEFDGGDFSRFPGLDNWLLLPINIIKLIFLVRKRQFDVVLLFKRKSGFIGWVLEKFCGQTKFVFNVANAWQGKKFLWDYLPAHICTLSMRLVPERVIKKKLVTEIKIGVPLLAIEDEVGEPLACSEQIRLISAGKLNYQKNHFKMIDVAKELIDRGHKVLVDIAGDGPNRDQLSNMAEKLGVSLQLRGQVSNMHEFYCLGGVYLQVSNFEGMPNALLEAGHYRIPIVANAVGATEDIVRDDTGWIVKSGDVRDYANAVESVINTSNDTKNKTSRMKALVAAEHDVAAMCSGYSQYISNISGD